MSKIYSKINNFLFYGWIVAVAGLIVGITSLGIRNSFGVFIKSLEIDFSLTRTITSSIFSLHLFLDSVYGVLAGWALDRYGPRKIIFLMGTFAGIGLIITSQSNTTWQLFLSYGILLSLGIGPYFVVVNSTVSRWFKRKRGLALGIAGAGAAAGTLIMAPIATYLNSTFGWRSSFILLGIVAWLIMTMMSLLIRRDPAEIGLTVDGENQQTNRDKPLLISNEQKQDSYLLSEAIKTGNFWLLSIVWLQTSLSVHLILTHIIPHTVDMGIPPISSSIILSLIGGSSIVGRILIGRISDNIGRKKPAISSAITQFILLFGLIWIRELWLFLLFAILFGLSWGGLSNLITALISDIFGTRSLGIIMAFISIGWTLGAAIGPFIGGLSYDLSGSYFISFAIGAAIMLISTAVIAFIRLPD
jgi:OFA family oxalate/formate antiporter-like MFS transporter